MPEYLNNGMVQLMQIADINGNVTLTGSAVIDFPLNAEVYTGADRLQPNSTVADQRITVSGTVGQFAAFGADCTHVFWTSETAEVRVTFDNSSPTATNGHVIPAGSTGIWSKALATAAKFIRTGSTNGVIHASELKT